MAQDIARIYQQCDPASALPPNDPRYVNRENTRGEGDLVCQLANAIRWSETPQHLLFAGHRGGGKSTELLRLQHALTNPAGGEAKFFVVYFEADEEDIDINDADFPDVLLAIIRQVGRAVREQAGIDLRPPWLDRLFSDLKRLLGSEVEFEKLELDAKIAKFTAAIRSSPDARHEIRRALEPNVSSLIQEANKLFDEAAAYVGESGYRDIVLIVDNLDRIVLRDIPGSQFNTHEQLFINRGAQLAQLRCHVVYTLPISIVFTPKGTTLANIFGRRPEVLPMVKIANRDGKGYPAGMAAMREIVRKRLGQAGVAESTAFDSGETLDYLCRMSGGHVRGLMTLVRSACTAAGSLPLTRHSIERSIRGMSNAFERALNKPTFFGVLQKVDQTHELPGSEHDQELLYNLSLLEYLNGEVWYSVNPAVRLLDKFQASRRAPRRAKRKSGG